MSLSQRSREGIRLAIMATGASTRSHTGSANAMLREVASAKDCAYADVWAAEGCCDHVIHQDTCHANKIGNLVIAHRVFETIVHAAPGIGANVRRRDETTEWTRHTAAARSMGVDGGGCGFGARS